MKKILYISAMALAAMVSFHLSASEAEGQTATGFVMSPAQTPQPFRSGVGNAAGNTAVAATVVPLAAEIDHIELIGQNATVAMRVQLWDAIGSASNVTVNPQSKCLGTYDYFGASPYNPVRIPGFKTTGRLWLLQTDTGTNTPVARCRYRLGAGARK